jgi:hypothetical protein
MVKKHLKKVKTIERSLDRAADSEKVEGSEVEDSQQLGDSHSGSK